MKHENETYSMCEVNKCVECPFHYQPENDSAICVLSKHPVSLMVGEKPKLNVILLHKGKLFPSFCPLKHLYSGPYGKADGVIVKVKE